MTGQVSVASVAALLGAALSCGLDVRSALEHVGRSTGGEAQALCGVAVALGQGVAWDAAWDASPERFQGLARALSPAWHQGTSPVTSLAALGDALVDRATAAGESAAAELGVRIALPLALCLMPAFVLTGIVPLLIALAGTVVGSAGGAP